MSHPGVKLSEGGLPVELAARLEPRLKHALDNPVRREILRNLNACECSRSIREITTELSNGTVSEIAYHARILEQAGGLVIDGSFRGLGSEQCLYASGMADDVEALAALRVTQQADRERGELRGRHSSKWLTAFRIPRPVLTIRLGDRKGGGHERRA